MQIQPTGDISFRYSHPLKTMWKKGKLPTVVYGFYGEKLTKKNISLEHLLPVSKGGKTKIDNLVLAHKDLNAVRGNRPISEVFNPKLAVKYFSQFLNIDNVACMSGQEYVERCFKTINELIQKGE